MSDERKQLFALLLQLAPLLKPLDEHLTIADAAKVLHCGQQYVRQHMDLFPNAYRLPGGEWRIPASDLHSLPKRRRAFLQNEVLA